MRCGASRAWFALVAAALWAGLALREPLLDDVGDGYLLAMLLFAAASGVGSLVLWQDGAANDTSLSHMHTIAGDLRHEVELKLLALWQPLSHPGVGVRSERVRPP